jgi:mannose-6-phosphate isomerase-like protein (cupin superfamily)
MKILRESPTSAFVRFKAWSVEPAHHHTFGHHLVVLEGKKSVWNITEEERYDLVVGDYLFIPAGHVHRVKYYEDTEFFVKWDGKWDMFEDPEGESDLSDCEIQGDCEVQGWEVGACSPPYVRSRPRPRRL